ncbi:MAG: NAD(P)-dependent oxidoreductase [Promethearchaeota archaeon]
MPSSQQTKIKCYLASPVFRDIALHPKVSHKKRDKLLKIWRKLKEETDLKVSKNRFPTEKEIMNNIDWGAQIIGCHLSHQITDEMINSPSSKVMVVCTSTAGYNHIHIEPSSKVLITHTPGVLHQTVADFALTLILSNLRNIINLHNYLWDGQWKPNMKWDLDENLSSIIDNKILGIIGMGEIGHELTRKIAPWGIKIIYYDIKRRKIIEKKFENVSYAHSITEVFSKSDIISLHLPLNTKTKHIIGESLFTCMKENSLLINTARGGIIDTKILLDLLERKKICISLAFDVYENEPINPGELKRFKNIAKNCPDLRIIFTPHNASADADTRAQMSIMMLEDILRITRSRSKDDITGISGIHLIPEQKKIEDFENYRISNLWS